MKPLRLDYLRKTTLPETSHPVVLRYHLRGLPRVDVTGPIDVERTESQTRDDASCCGPRRTKPGRVLESNDQ